MKSLRYQANKSLLSYLGLAAVLLGQNCLAANQAASPEPQSLYVVEAESGNELQLPQPVLPDIDSYSEQAVREKMAALDRSGNLVIEIRRMFDEITLHDFTAAERAGEWARRQSSHPKAIFIKAGVARPQDIYRLVDNPLYFDKLNANTYIARLPLVIERHASLVLDGGEAKQVLRFSQEYGSFLVVAGKLFALRTQLQGWSERKKQPAKFTNENDFRPFLVSWSGSELYLVGSQVESFGYNTSKSYGITVSRYSDQFDSLQLPSPEAWIINSNFIDMYYGFYCYYANNLVLVGNRYLDNIVYGIDPHDFSSGLLIADNTVIGTKEKHGLIISRSVNDSWIVNNRVHGSALSGIVIDRASSRNIIAFNHSFKNGSDGITIYESSDNLLWGNMVYDNKKHGIRARNSVDVKLYYNKVLANGSYGVYGHVRDLDDTDRDLELDPYSSEVSLTVVGGSVGANQRGSLAIDQPLSVRIYGVDFRFSQGPYGVLLDGVLARFQDTMLDIVLRQKQAAVLKPADERVGVN